MPCFKPLIGYRTLENTANGKKKIAFQKSPEYQHEIKLPCGQCIGCRLERSSMWATRCVHEAQLHEQNCFITLTYSDDHLPWDRSLVKSHFTAFMKKLRKRYHTQKIRFYMCGEYGEKLSRPHYHACLFGIDFPDKEIYTIKEGLPLYTSEILESIWGRGYCTIGELTHETAAYTARYIMKKITGDKAEEHYQTTCEHTGNLIQLEPEYNNMSLKPGIGKQWYDQFKTDVYPSDYLIRKGSKISVPRYYDKLYEIEGGDLEKIKKQRKKKARKYLKDNTPERLAVREKVKQLNLKKLTRSYESNDT